MRRAAAAVVLGALTAVLAPMVGVTPTWATFTDTSGLSGTTFTTYTVPAPTGVTCSKQSNAFRISWTAAPGATNYTVYINGTAVSSAQAGTTYDDPNKATGRTINIVSNRAFTSTTWTSAQTATKTESIVGSTWTCP